MTTLNALQKISSKKIRVGRGIGSGKGKTSGRGIKGQKSRSGVAIKSFEGGQMPLYRRLPKRGFNSISKKHLTGIINLSQIQKLIDNSKLSSTDLINLSSLQKKNLGAKRPRRTTQHKDEPGQTPSQSVSTAVTALVLPCT